MKVMFRPDVSERTGLGHLSRCLTLADELSKHGASVAFILDEQARGVLSILEAKGYSILWIDPATRLEDEPCWMSQRLKPPIVDWIVVDHYRIERTWEMKIRPLTRKIMVIDDLADRAHDCDVLLDQNAFSDHDDRYDTLVPAAAIKLLGCQYALLRPQFAEVRTCMKPRAAEIANIMISYGGSDPTHEVVKALECVIHEPHIHFHIVLGTLHSRKEQIRDFCRKHDHVSLYIQTDRMADIMATCDLALCSAGTMTWERYCLGLPGVTTAVASNQISNAKNGHEMGIDYYLGTHDQVTPADLIRGMEYWKQHPERRLEASIQAMQLVNGLGVQKIVEVLYEMSAAP